MLYCAQRDTMMAREPVELLVAGGDGRGAAIPATGDDEPVC
jgi:hypothetical protein